VIEPLLITSRDNPRLALIRRLCKDPTAYRKNGKDGKDGQIWLEGDHLLRARLARGGTLATVVLTASAWQQDHLRELALQAQQVLLLTDELFAALSSLPSPAAIGALIERPAAVVPREAIETVILDRVQDAGNVGSILRSAAALGVAQVVALPGCAALWSPKVLRAAMGAHFALRLCEAVPLVELAHLKMPWLATGSHGEGQGARPLHEAALPSPCAWVFGHEGQGIADEVAARCQMTLRIAQPGGEESLNVAAAAAICLHESARQRIGDAAPMRQ
jgi:TrmH family RNA methyltransferase